MTHREQPKSSRARALISTDARFGSDPGGGSGIRSALDSRSPFPSRLRRRAAPGAPQANPDLVFIDLENDAEMGAKLIQFLAESNPGQQFIALGPLLTPELFWPRCGREWGITCKPVDLELAGALDRVTHRSAGPPARRPPARADLLLLQPQGRLRLHHRGHQSCGRAAPAHRQAHPAGGPRPGAGRGGAVSGGPAAVQLRGSGAELPPDGRRALASYIEQHVRRPSAVGAVPPGTGRGRRAEQIRRILQFLRQHYDYILVDTSKSFSPDTLAAFDQSDLVFLVTGRFAVAAEHPAGAADAQAGPAQGRGPVPPDREPV